MLQKNHKGMALGAVLGSLLGMISSHPNKTLTKGREWMDKAKEIGETVINEVKHLREGKEEEHKTPPFVAGALMGLLLGASAALLLTPKTGKQLRNHLTKQYGNIIEQAHEYVDQMNHSKPVAKAKKQAAKLAKNIDAKKRTIKKAVTKVKRKIKKAVR